MLLTEYDEVKHYERVYRNAHRDGKEEGLAEGIAQGKAEGIAQGKAEGIAQGKAEGIVESIVNMMQALKLSFDQATSVMKIPDEEFTLYKKLIAGLGHTLV